MKVSNKPFWDIPFRPLNTTGYAFPGSDERIKTSQFCSKCASVRGYLEENYPREIKLGADGFEEFRRKVEDDASAFPISVEWKKDEGIQVLPWHESAREIEQSFEQGCHPCSLFRANLGLTRMSYSQRDPHQPKFPLDTATFEGSANELSTTGECTVGERTKTRFDLETLHYENDSIHGSAEATTTNSPSTLEFMVSCFQECQANHKDCSPGSDQFIPTRLLNLSDIANDRIFLQTNRTGGLSNQYAALSYKWGGDLSFKLTTKNFENFLLGIPVSSLPKTIRDAVYVCHHFGIMHLWVDSCCILQDSKDDWLHEATTMSDVYLDSRLTIGSLDAANAFEGLFSKRNPLILQECRLFNLPDNSTIALAPQKSYDFRFAPLHERGWVTQERLLAPRTINIGTACVWECRTHIRCDIKPTTISQYSTPAEIQKSLFKRILSTELLETAPGTSSSTSSANDIHAFIQTWNQQIVEYYAQTNLTYESDRLIAMAGLVAHIARRTHLPHHAGLWAAPDNTLSQLPWFVGGDQNARKRFDHAPTWSWASTNSADTGGLNGSLASGVAGMRDSEIYAQVRLEALGFQEKFAGGEGTGLLLRGPVCEMGALGPVMDFGRPVEGLWTSRLEGIVEGFGSRMSVYFDAMGEYDFKGELRLICFGFGKMAGGDLYEGMVVQKCRKKLDTAKVVYERVGWAHSMTCSAEERSMLLGSLDKAEKVEFAVL